MWRAKCDPSVGFIFGNRVIKWERLDNRSFIPLRRKHRDGQHKATRSTDCIDCLNKFRREILGHNV